MLFCNAGSRRRYCYLCGFLRYNFIPLFVFPVCLGSLPNFLHSSFRIMSHNEIMEKKFRKIVTPKAIPDILRYIIKLPDLSVVCKFDFQHLLLGIVPGRLDHGICPHYSLHLLFSLSHPACCHPWHKCPLAVRRSAVSFSWKISPYTFTWRFLSHPLWQLQYILFFPSFSLMQVLAYFLNTLLYPHPQWFLLQVICTLYFCSSYIIKFFRKCSKGLLCVVCYLVVLIVIVRIWRHRCCFLLLHNHHNQHSGCK